MRADRIRRVDGSSRLLRSCAGAAVAALTFGTIGTASAQGVSDAQIKVLQQQIDQLQRTVNQLKAWRQRRRERLRPGTRTRGLLSDGMARLEDET